MTDGSGASDRAAAFRQLITAGTAGPDDLAGVLSRVCRIATRELAAFGAGISVMTDEGVRGLCAASDVASERLDDLQFVLGEGPCIDAFSGRRPVLIADLSAHVRDRWPAYTPAAHGDGIRAVFAFPLQVGAARLGAMDVFRQRSGALTATELGTALLLADLAVEAVLDRHENLGRQTDADGLVLDVGNRARLFQAQGMVMVQLGVPLAEAIVRMRAYAFAENRRLDDVARDIVNRRLRLDADPT